MQPAAAPKTVVRIPFGRQALGEGENDGVAEVPFGGGGGGVGVVACLLLAAPPCPSDEVGHCPTQMHKRCSSQCAPGVPRKWASTMPVKARFQCLLEGIPSAWHEWAVIKRARVSMGTNILSPDLKERGEGVCDSFFIDLFVQKFQPPSAPHTSPGDAFGIA